MRIPACLLVSLMVILWGCADEKNEPKGGKPSVIFADYRFTGDEGKEMVTGLLQFFEGSRKGEPMRLTPPAGIQVDGVALVADSALRTGAYYEVQQPLQQFPLARMPQASHPAATAPSAYSPAFCPPVSSYC